MPINILSMLLWRGSESGSAGMTEILNGGGPPAGKDPRIYATTKTIFMSVLKSTCEDT
jgi:hypothetical protein